MSDGSHTAPDPTTTDAPTAPPTASGPDQTGPVNLETGRFAALDVGPRTRSFRRAIEARAASREGLSTFRGVFLPTILMILGVMIYLRLGWVVGEAGLGGAVLVVLVSFVITGTTALSLSSITTNIRLGAGGVFSVISQSLGLETGGAIGIPLYLAQAMSAALYIYGFNEAWHYIFPDHPPALIVLGTFLAVCAVTLISVRLVFRLQWLVGLAVLGALVSMVLGMTELGPAADTLHNPQWWGEFADGDFWEIFAVFFPAGTGIMIGVSLSRSLKNPRRSIPRGSSFAVIVALLIYLVLAAWYGAVATPDELRQNFLIAVERAAYGPLVLAGILGSTFTAAMSSMVAAPRVLQALARHRILPWEKFLAARGANAEPRNATLITGALVGAALLLGSLDRVAVLITMFFLLTYVSINVVVFIEQSLGMVSFRPRFRVPLWVPALGSMSCMMAIFIISPTFALFAMGVVVAIYVWLVNRKLESPWETVRSSIFVSLADWAARRVASQHDEANERSWKPDLLVPVTSRTQLDGSFRFLRAMVFPKGSLQVVGIRLTEPETSPEESEKSTEQPPTETAREAPDAPSRPRLPAPPAISGLGMERLPACAAGRANLDALTHISREFQEIGIYATAVAIEAASMVKGVEQTCAVMRGSYFRPNVLFGLAHTCDDETLQGMLDASIAYQLGAAFLYLHPEAGLGHEHTLNVWIRDQSPDWHLGLRLANLDLSILFAYQLFRNWHGKIRLCTVCQEEAELPMAQAYLAQLIEDARLPSGTQTWVEPGRFLDRLTDAPHADLAIMGLSAEVDVSGLERLVIATQSSILFVRDSGRESALA